LEFIEVARVVKPHGLVGELGVLMHWEGSDALELVERVRVVLPDGSTRELTLAKVQPSGKGYRVKFVGVDDRTAAESLRGAKILVERALLPPLEAGETFLSDLVGQVVLGPDGGAIGRVVDIASYPSVDSLVIEKSDGSRVEQPLVEDWVKPFEPGKSVIELTSLDGLLG
jgi:16S rRNA processing protein RimM